MSLHTGKILEIMITNDKKNIILEEVQKYLLKSSKSKVQSSKKRIKPLIIVTPNPEQMVYAQRDSHFAEIMNQADIALPDGIGIVWASRLLVPPGVPERIPGVEFMENLVAMTAGRGVRVALIGGRGSLAVKAFDCLQQKYPGVIGWGEDGPKVAIRTGQLVIDNEIHTQDYFSALARKIMDTGTQMIFVGLGAPKQEYFIEKLSYQLSVISKTDHRSPITDNSSIVLMSVGGAFDIVSGRMPRAPLFIRLMGFEWAWRLLREPWRFRRQLAILRFIGLVLREKLSRG